MRAVLALLVVLGVTSACGDGSGPPAAGPGAGWERLPDAPLSGRTGASVVGIGDRAYVFGGWEFLCPPNADCAGPSEPAFADGAVVDLETGEWSAMADAPVGMAYAGTAVLGGDVYAVSRCRADQSCGGPAELLRYATATDEWSALGRLPRGVDGSLVATDHGLLVVAGTEENGEVHDALYDPAAGTWQVLPNDPMPPTFDRFAVADGDRVLVLGSPIVAPDEESGTKLGAVYDLVGGTWTELPPAPGPGYQVWRAGDRAFLNPHYGDGGGVLDLATDRWSAFPEGPDDRNWTSDLAGLVSEHGATYEYADGWVLDARDDQWLEVPPRGGDAYDESVGAAGQALVVFGGQAWDGDDGRLLAEAWVWQPPS